MIVRARVVFILAAMAASILPSFASAAPRATVQNGLDPLGSLPSTCQSPVNRNPERVSLRIYALTVDRPSSPSFGIGLHNFHERRRLGSNGRSLFKQWKENAIFRLQIEMPKK